MVFFVNDTATTEIYTLSLHDALPIFRRGLGPEQQLDWVAAQPQREEDDDRDGEQRGRDLDQSAKDVGAHVRSEEHTSELQSRQYLVCRLLLEKKKKE